MDGVLFDSEPIHIRAWQTLLMECRVTMPDEWFLQFVGIPDRETALHVATLSPGLPDAAELLARKRVHYRAITARELQPFPGVREGLHAVTALGVPLALATSSPRAEAEHVLTATELLGYFPIRVSIDDVVHPKPAPDPYLLAAERLGCSPTACTVIEDSPAGVAAARAAGCQVLAVTSSHAVEALAAAVCIFPTTADALAWVQTRESGHSSGLWLGDLTFGVD